MPPCAEDTLHLVGFHTTLWGSANPIERYLGLWKRGKCSSKYETPPPQPNSLTANSKLKLRDKIFWENSWSEDHIYAYKQLLDMYISKRKSIS